MERSSSNNQETLADLVIRKVTEPDLTALEWEGAYLHYRRMYAGIYRAACSGTTLMWLVETAQGALVGQAFVMLVSTDKSAADGRERAYVFAFRVKPAWRNQGVGAYLMEFIEDDLRKRGFKTVTLNVAKDNPGALRLYRRLGYRVIGSKPGVWSYKDHQGKLCKVNEPAWRMHKHLA